MLVSSGTRLSRGSRPLDLLLYTTVAMVAVCNWCSLKFSLTGQPDGVGKNPIVKGKEVVMTEMMIVNMVNNSFMRSQVPPPPIPPPTLSAYSVYIQ